MGRYRVTFRPQAEIDLFRIYRYIAAASGPAVAGTYVDRIEAACMALQAFPKRGRKQDSVRQGLRTIGFERRATISYRIIGSRVQIIRIFYGGQDLENALRGSKDD